MFPGIIVFGLVLAVAYTFTKVGEKSPITETISKTPIISQVPRISQSHDVHPAAVAVFNRLTTGPQLVEMTDAEFAAAKETGGAGPAQPSDSFANSVFSQADSDQRNSNQS